MKTIKNIILVLASMYLLNACSFLDKDLDTELTLEMVFEDKIRMEGWLANVIQVFLILTGVIQKI